MNIKHSLAINPRSNLLAEDEAKTKWCPLANAHGDSMLRGVTRDADRNWQHTLCIGSACMAWRQVDQVGRGPNGEKRDRDMDGRTQWIDRGYCGAFGLPKALLP